MEVEDIIKVRGEFTLGSHLPVLQAILKVLQPESIMELGVGKKSTPLLYNYGKKLISIETDKQWIYTVKAEVGNRKDFNLIHHDVEPYGLHPYINYTQIPTTVGEECISFYNTFINDGLDFLFVDHIAGLRVIVLMSLFNKFKVIAYHDAEFRGYHWEEFLKTDISGYSHWMFESLGIYTGIVMHNIYDEKFNKFNEALEKYGKEYCEKFDGEYQHKLRKIR